MMQQKTRCTGKNCNKELSSDRLQITMDMDGGTRNAYECSCGAITITVTENPEQ